MLDLGEIVTLDNNKEFMCFERVQLDGKDFLYLIATDDSGEICFAEQAEHQLALSEQRSMVISAQG